MRRAAGRQRAATATTGQARYRRADPENRPNWLASTAMLRALPTSDSAAMTLHAAMMSRQSVRSPPPGERAFSHMTGGRMKVTGMRPIEDMRPLQWRDGRREVGVVRGRAERTGAAGAGATGG